MSPKECIDWLAATKSALGDAAFAELEEQISYVRDDFNDIETIEGVYWHDPTIRGAIAAALVTRQLQHSNPCNPLSGWDLEHQLRAVYSLIACTYDNYFGIANVGINFGSDLPISHVAKMFHDCPVTRERPRPPR